MNNKRRKQINGVKRKLRSMTGIDKSLQNYINELESILSDEEFAFDNMPESLQDSIRGCDSQDAQEALNDAIDILEDAHTREDIQDAIESLEEIM